jgi:hypothetical protein
VSTCSDLWVVGATTSRSPPLIVINRQHARIDALLSNGLSASSSCRSYLILLVSDLGF